MTDVKTPPAEPATATAAPPARDLPTAPQGLIVLGAPDAEACADGSCG